MNPASPTRRSLAWTLAVAATPLLAAGGCGDANAEGMDVFEQIGQLPKRERFVEVELGHFFVPVPIVLETATEMFEADNLIQIELDLVAIVDPREESLVRRLMERNAGRVRHEIIRVCRSTTRDDLVEPQKSTLKAHLLDAVQPLLGGHAVRRLAIRRVNVDEL